MDENKRKHPRLPFAATVEIQVGADSIFGATRDISTTGFYLENLVMPPLDTPGQGNILLANGEVTDTIKSEGKVIHHIQDAQRQGLGGDFVDLDPESPAYLWRVIRYNSPAKH